MNKNVNINFQYASYNSHSGFYFKLILRSSWKKTIIPNRTETVHWMIRTARDPTRRPDNNDNIN